MWVHDISTLTHQTAEGSYYFLYGIEVNGQILTQGSDFSNSDYDLMVDSPTQNWATINPLNSNATSISNANLEYVGDTGGSYTLGVIGSQRCFQWEILLGNSG